MERQAVRVEPQLAGAQHQRRARSRRWCRTCATAASRRRRSPPGCGNRRGCPAHGGPASPAPRRESKANMRHAGRVGARGWPSTFLMVLPKLIAAGARRRPGRPRPPRSWRRRSGCRAAPAAPAPAAPDWPSRRNRCAPAAAPAQRAEILLHAVHVQHQARRRRLLVSKETGDFRSHRAGLPQMKRPPDAGDGRSCETVERTSDQTNWPGRDAGGTRIARTLDVVA